MSEISIKFYKFYIGYKKFNMLLNNINLMLLFRPPTVHSVQYGTGGLKYKIKIRRKTSPGTQSINNLQLSAGFRKKNKKK